jgi:hypothetical protein
LREEINRLPTHSKRLKIIRFSILGKDDKKDFARIPKIAPSSIARTIFLVKPDNFSIIIITYNRH